MNYRFQHKLKLLTLTVSINALCANYALADTIGREVSNIANVAYNIGDSRVNVPTNEVVFTIEPPRVIPVIEFYRYSPNAPNPNIVQINGSEYSPSGDLNGPFSSTGDPISTGNLIDLSGPVPLIPADTYLSGELMFIRLDYATGNVDASVIDTLVITVEAENGDFITLKLFESGPNTGEFWAYLPSTPDVTAPNDPFMTAGTNDQLIATFTSQNNAGFEGNLAIKSVADSAVVNPFNTVFDSVTGIPVSGAELTIVDLGSGLPASVLGVDGFSEYPSEIISGEEAEDTAGLVYAMDPGMFAFPNLQPGQYAIEVIPPAGYTFASTLTPDLINDLTGAAYFIIDASYGEAYNVDDLSALRFDIPLDPQSELAVTKVADRSYADVGDYINYTVSVQNLGGSPVPLNLRDTLPRGFRYVGDTSRVDTITIEDPVISSTGTDLIYDLGIIAPSSTVQLNYALRVGPGGFVTGEAINAVVARDGAGNPISNVGRASVKLREDLLRSRSTVVGRITHGSCNGTQDWARDIDIGKPVEGVRLYMETGAYVVSDNDGLFHFEGVKEGTHVVQVDEETLPAGFELMSCEENTRYAGRANSKFIDVQGGGIWRANFYLKQTSEVVEEAAAEKSFTDQTEYQKYDDEWLETQSSGIEWAYPKATPSIPSANIGIKHGAGQKVSLKLNGADVPVLNYEGRDSNAAKDVMLSRWRGLDILTGKNRFEVTVTDKTGRLVKRFDHDLHYVTTVEKAAGVPSQSVLIADGRTTPEIAIRLEDASGHGVNAGRIVQVEIEDPYRLEIDDRIALSEDLIEPFSARSEVTVGVDGIARVKLEPTLKTGKVTANVKLDNGRIVPIHMYLEPEQRDWIVVGLAEGTVGYNTIRDRAVALTDSESDTLFDNRMAFFAKGMIKGKWLMTLAVDTDKERGDQDGDFAQEIDPNAYYTLYGDRTYQEYEAQSRYPVYVKLEKKSAYALFGDFNTDITEGRLTSYRRRLSGLKAEYIGEKFQVLGFAAETNQGFALDEIAADGTSGTYRLTNGNLLAQSENIVVETRDRNRPDIVLETRNMKRYLDYTLDYLTGNLVFRLPVDATDENFNPNVIVAQYETSEDAERNVTFGGRAQTQFLDNKVQVGASFVSENGSALSRGSKQNMIGVDAVAQVTDSTEVRVEYAVTENETSPEDGRKDAILAEVIHTSENLSAQAYFRQEDGGFGLGQRQSNTNGVRRYGINANLKVREFENEKSGTRGSQSIEGLAYREENLETGDTRDNAEIIAKHSGERITVSAGIRAVEDNFANKEDRDSVLAIGQASLTIPKHKTTFRVTHEQSLSGQDEVSAYPNRTSFGVDKTFGNKINASVRHDIFDGNGVSGENTIFGLSAAPWTGANFTASTDVMSNNSGRRLGATFGLDQQVKLSDKWSASGGFRNRNIIDAESEYVEVAPDAAVSPFETNADFTSGYAGLGYRTKEMSGSVRLEGRKSDESETWIGSAAIAREVSEELSLAGALRGTDYSMISGSGSMEQIDARLGASWRPRDEKTIVLDRFDFGYYMNANGEVRTKLVNNLAVNQMIDEKWQVSVNHGIKFVEETIAGQSYDTLSNLVGLETRFDITEKFDLGLRGQAIVDDEGNTSYSFGPSIGVSPVENVWISAGYNLQGYSDDDFEASEYSKEGAYLQLRLKFDQHSARGLLKHISPTEIEK